VRQREVKKKFRTKQKSSAVGNEKETEQKRTTVGNERKREREIKRQRHINDKYSDKENRVKKTNIKTERI
jgi:hypothetical protein